MNATYLDASAPIGARVDDLLARMTVEEKVGQMMQLDAREGVEDHILRMHVGSILHTSPERLAEAHDLTGQTRLRIPLLVGEDCIHGHSFFVGATIFPTQLGMAASWDAGLVEQVARATAVEVAATGVHWTFSPVLCIARDLRWGRVDETFGEDPFLIGELASAMVRGYQGTGLDDPTAILATAKHFAGYSETQGGRDASEADISRRKLRSWFLPPFERVAREGCATFMLGYQTTDGVPITVNDWLLNDVLRGEWGYSGTLITDWDNVGRMVWEQKVQPDYAHAAAAAVKAGNDMVMTTPGFFQGALDAIRSELLAESDLDAAVARILTLKFRLGLFENPRRPDPAAQVAVVGSVAHAELNLAVARRSLVLLTNDGVLPLAGGLEPAPGTGPAGALRAAPGTAARTIAVVGPLADDAQTQLGDWAGSSGQADWLPDGQPVEMITTVLDGLRATVPQEWAITHARGADILTLAPDPAGATFVDGQPRPPLVVPCEPDEALIAEAVAAARDADYVVAVVGDRIELVGEGRSTATLELIGGQIALLDALAATGTPLVVVLLASKPLVLPDSALDAAALLWVANPGMQGGQAVAELLLGLVEPSGRLPVSFARHVGQQPTYYNQVRGQHGDRYADLTQEPAFVFVHDGRVLGPAARGGRPRGRRRRPGLGHAREHRGPAGAGDRAGVRLGPGDVGVLGRQGAQGVPAGRPGPRRDGHGDDRGPGRGLHDRRRRRHPGGRAGRVRAPGGPVVPRRDPPPGGVHGPPLTRAPGPRPHAARRSAPREDRPAETGRRTVLSRPGGPVSAGWGARVGARAVGGASARGRGSGAQGPVQVAPEVLDVLDADREAQQVLGDRHGLGGEPAAALDAGLHAAEAGRRHPQAQPLHDRVGTRGAAGRAQADDRAVPAHLRGRARVPDLHDAGVRGQPLREVQGGALRALDPQGQRPDAAQRQVHLERAGDRPVHRAVGVQPLAQARVVGEHGAEDDVAVPGEVLGHRVHDDVRAVLQRPLHQRGGEGVVDGDQRARGVPCRDEGRQVRDLEHRVGRRLHPDQRRGAAGGGGGRVQRRGHGGGVRDVDLLHLDVRALREVAGVAERHLVRVLRQDQPAAVRHQGQRRGDRRHAGAVHQRRVRRALQGAERLLERTPGLGVAAGVHHLAGLRHALGDVRRRQHDGRVHGGALRAGGPSGGDGEGLAGEVLVLGVAHAGQGTRRPRRAPRASHPAAGRCRAGRPVQPARGD
jgi:beta-glucosidase